MTKSKKKHIDQIPPEPAVKPSEPSEKTVLIGALAVFIITAVSGLLADAPWDDDCLSRYYNTRQALSTPTHFVDQWNRPLFILLFFLTAHLGKFIIPIQMGLIGFFTYYATYKAAQALKIRNAFLAIPFVAFQTFYFPISYAALAEPLAACLMALGIMFYARRQFVALAIVGGFLPLARMELAVLLAFWGLIAILEKQWKILPIFAVPTLLWAIAGAILYHDPIWLYSSVTTWSEPNRYARMTFGHYFQTYIYVIGPILFYFVIIGLVEKIVRRKIDLMIISQFVAGFLLYVVISWKSDLAAGFLRHLITLSPLAAILALYGYNAWSDVAAATSQKIRILAYSIIMVGLTYVFFSFVLWGHHSITTQPEYTKLLIILSLTFFYVIMAFGLPMLFKRKNVRMALAGGVATAAMLYTLITEHPDKYFSPERQALVELGKTYIENGWDKHRTYCNHPWFYYGQDFDQSDTTRFNLVTQKNLDNAPDSSIVIWENHYSHRLAGNVQISYFQDKPNFKVLAQKMTDDQGYKFGYVIFQKTSQ